MENILDKTKNILSKILNKIKDCIKYILNHKFKIFIWICYPIFLHYILYFILGIKYTISFLGIGRFFYKCFHLIRTIPITQFITVLIMIIPKPLIYEYMIISAIIFIFLGITGKLKKSIIITSIFVTGFASINYFIMQLRGIPFVLTDIYAILTAINVAEGYSLHISLQYIISIALVIVYVKIIFLVQKKEIYIRKVLLRIVMIITGIIILLVIQNTKYVQNIKLWNIREKNVEYGQLIMLLREFSDFNIQKPDKYTKQKAEEILATYKTETTIEEELPNVIVIMNESFSNLKDTYQLEMEENIPFVQSLKDNTIKGTMYSSTLGTGTSTIEWEFLTGNSSAFIPYGSTPYMQYVRKERESLVTIFNTLDYTTKSIHAYKASGYNRKNAYMKLGFQESYFLEDMKYTDCFTEDYPTDKFTYRYSLDRNKNEKGNVFNFIITMQNHSPYPYQKNITHDYVGDKKVDEYLTLVRESDKALQDLIEEIKEQSKKTIVLFFGDHQPGFVNDKEMFTETQWGMHYQVPFFIWANYDIEEQENVEISANYLSVLLADVAKIPKSDYMNFLEKLKQTIPVININGYKDCEGNIYEIEDKTSPYYDCIQEYKMVQYYQMFDR